MFIGVCCRLVGVCCRLVGVCCRLVGVCCRLVGVATVKVLVLNTPALGVCWCLLSFSWCWHGYNIGSKRAMLLNFCGCFQLQTQRITKDIQGEANAKRGVVVWSLVKANFPAQSNCQELKDCYPFTCVAQEKLSFLLHVRSYYF